MPRRVLLVNYGAYSKEGDIKTFLKNLFSDEVLFPFPEPLRKLLGFLISEIRFREGKRLLEAMGGKSPLLEQSNEQKNLLTERLGKDYRLQVAMRYSEPLLENVLKNFDGEEELIILPMFPHYSAATYGSVEKIARKVLKGKKFVITEPFYYCKNFIRGWLEAVEKVLVNTKSPLLLFSAHSLPLYLVKRFNDPYPFQVEESAKIIAEYFGLPYKVSYQSRLGPIKWLRPSTEEIIKEIASATKGAKEVVVIPISFVAENSETLVEIDIFYKNLAKEMGMENFIRVPIPYNSPKWIDCFKELVEEAEKKIPI